MFTPHIAIAAAAVYFSKQHFLEHINKFTQGFALGVIVFAISLYVTSSVYLYQLERHAKARGAILAPKSTSFPFIAIYYMARNFSRVNLEGLFTCIEPGISNDPALRKDYAMFNLQNEAFYSLITKDPQIIKAVFSVEGFRDFGRKPNAKTTFAEFTGTGVFNITANNSWKYQRNLLKPFFNKDRIKQMNVDNIDKLIGVLLTRAKDNKAIDVYDAFIRFTFGNSLEFFTGYKEDSWSSHSNKYYDAFEKVRRKIMRDFSLVMLDNKYATGALMNVLKFFPYFSVDNEIKLLRKLINNIVDKELASNKESTQSTSNSRKEAKSFLHYLVTQTDDRTLIQDLTLNLMIAGRDTSASLLSSVLYEFAKNPEIYKQTREEVLRLFGEDGAPEQDRDAIKDTKFIQAVLSETLRFYPPASLNAKFSLKDNVLTGSDGKRYYIPKNTSIYFHYWLMQRDPAFWGNDADKWDPYRWIDCRFEKVSSNPSIYQPFSCGPRICPGIEFTYQVTTLVLIRLCQKFERIERATDVQPNVLPIIKLSLNWKGGMWLRMTPNNTESLEKGENFFHSEGQ